MYIYIHIYISGWWWSLPLWNIWVRQLGLVFPIWKKITKMLQATKQIWYGDGSKPWYLVNPKIAGKWMFIPLKMVLIGIDPYPYSRILGMVRADASDVLRSWFLRVRLWHFVYRSEGTYYMKQSQIIWSKPTIRNFWTSDSQQFSVQQFSIQQFSKKHWLVVDQALWKLIEWKSVGMMKFQIYPRCSMYSIFTYKTGSFMA